MALLRANAILSGVRAENVALRAQATRLREIFLKVVTLEGVAGPLEDLASEVVRDHEELESRIEAVLTISPIQLGPQAVLDRDDVHRLLRGGTRVPDTIPDGFGG